MSTLEKIEENIAKYFNNCHDVLGLYMFCV